MPLYTVVTEGYDVTVYRSRNAVYEDMASNGLCLKVDGDDEPTPAKAKQIAPALSSDCVVRLWPEDGSDWTPRIERHNK